MNTSIKDVRAKLYTWKGPVQIWPVEIGNELFWYIFDGEPQAKNGFIELDDSKPGLGIELSKKYLNEFDIEI